MEYEKDWWKTRDHKKIKICDMETSHIKNVIKYLERNPEFYDVCYGFGSDWDTYDYEDNSHLVDKKIEELQYELDKREKKYE